MGDRSKRALALAPSWLAAALLGAAIVYPFHPLFRVREPAYEFEARVSSSEPGIVQLYYDVGRGFNEADSKSGLIRASGRPKPIRFRLPRGRYGALRFDPLNGAGVVTVSGALIHDDDGRVVARFPPSAFEATQQIKRMSVNGDTLTIETVPGADDPNTFIRLERPLSLAAPAYREWVASLEYLAAAFLVVLAAVAAASRIPRAGIALALGGAARRPNATLALTALLALLLNSYPVILFGRSFVSPNNGVVLLYDEIPTLPGYDSESTENQMGSDVGAVMWWHIPVSRVQSEAIFHDHELPLWNRYDLCGQPLLGQGQSMIGDPLHLATAVLFGGGALAWDIKYLVAKWLFAFGMGLTVLALTDRLAVAMVLAASSLFIGFFSFRLNHPAIFSLCYSPWILYSWIRIAGSRDSPGTLGWTGALFAANWVEINSGTVKEAYVLTAWLNLAGFLVLVLGREEGRLRLRKALTVGWAAVLFVLVSSPIWLTFLDTLAGSTASRSEPGVLQLPASRLIGFFEDLFYRQAAPREAHVAPSTNFLVLIGILWALSNLRRLSGNRAFVALGLSAIPPILLVYGLIPGPAIAAVPFLGGISHIHDTFSCVLIILAIPLSGIGLKVCLDSLGGRSWLPRFAVVVLLLGALLGLYFGVDRRLPVSGFFAGYLPTLLAAFVLLQLAVRHLAGRAPDTAAASLVIILCLLAIHWRQGQYLKTAYDDYVFNPQVRADFGAESPAVRLIKEDTLAPSRALGLGLNLFPGFNATYLIEDILGIEALRSREYQDLAEALGLERLILFTKVQADEESGRFQAAYDMLNVRYFLGRSRPAPDEIRGWERLRKLDLTVYRSPAAWPRAFFVDRVGRYSGLGDLVARVRSTDGRPFAAVEDQDVADMPELAALPADAPGREVVAATNYSLTNNTTSFDVEVRRPGVVVLSETWLRDDFRATVNGSAVPYFRVNHAFKGICLDGAGRYRISFRYWPRHLTPSLWMSALGLALGCGSCLVASRRFRARPGDPGTA
ncbi:MAG: hypothetical protein ABSH26_02620 [Opitutaceae bacterium]